MTEKGVSDWVIQAQVVNVDPQMMKTYSHIRRKDLNKAAAALEPRQILRPDAVAAPQTETLLIG